MTTPDFRFHSANFREMLKREDADIHQLAAALAGMHETACTRSDRESYNEAVALFRDLLEEAA